MKGVTIPQDLAQGIANYLARQPWVEVNELLQALLKASRGANVGSDQSASG